MSMCFINKESIILRISWSLNESDEIDDKLALVTTIVTKESASAWDWCTLGCKEDIEMVYFLFKVWYKFVVD